MKLTYEEKVRLCMDIAEAEKIQNILEKEDIRKDGIKEGIKEGKEEERINNIKTMYKNGASIETISKLLGFDIEYIKNIVENS